MPSCSNSSNINSTINTLSVSQGGSRLLVSVPYVSGLTLGDVIRYDISTSGYTASKANLAENSEVFGVIESYDSVSSKFGVVIYGSISLDSTKFADMGYAGGSGGNDIYFLSGQTAGVLQNLAPSDLEYVVKPIYQVSPHGSYSGVIVNYLGYKIGGDIQASFLDTESIGNTLIVVGDSTFDEGYVDASTSHQLTISDYPEFYSKYGTIYGYVERLTVSEAVSGSIVANLQVSQTSSSYSGKIVSVDYPNKYIYVLKSPDSALASTNKQISISVTSTTSTKLTVTASQIYSVYTPVITLSQPLSIYGKSGENLSVTQDVKIGIKVKPLGVRVSVPSNVSTSSLTTTTLKLGTNQDDVETILNDFESRITAIETRLRL
jgi:hypothetical protein